MPQIRANTKDANAAAPPGFAADSEANLIGWLAQQRRDGATLDAQAQQGSMLHHAIRGGLEDTALWLLDNGANALQHMGHVAEQPDALVLAMQYRRWKVLQALLQRADVVAPERDSTISRTWQEAMQHGNADVERLLAAGLRWPQDQEGTPAAKAGTGALNTALRQRCYGLLLRKLPPVPGTTAPALPPDLAACDPALPPALLLTLDARLPQPLYPHLLREAASKAQLDALAALPLRRPYDDDAFLFELLNNVIYRIKSRELQYYAMRQIPRERLRQLLDNGYLFRDWLRWAALQSPEGGEWALDLLGDSLPQRAALALQSMTQGVVGNDIVGFDPRAGTPELSAGWERLLRRLPAPLPPVTITSEYSLWSVVPAGQRPLLLQRGYILPDRDLSSWLRNSTPAQLAAQWPALQAAQPDLRERALPGLLGGFGRNDDAGKCSSYSLSPQISENALRLKAAGAQMASPVVLTRRCQADADAKALAALQGAGLVEVTAAETARFVEAKPNCNFQPDSAWRDALAGRQEQGGLPLRNAQLVAIPGETRCAVLVFANIGGGRELITERDGDDVMTYYGGCAEERAAAAIWRGDGTAITATPLDAFSLLRSAVAVKDTRDGQSFLLGGQLDTNRCGAMPMTLLTWATPPGADATVKLVAADTALQESALAQCSDSIGDPVCSGGSQDDPYIVSFVERHWPAQRDVYLNAVQALDYAVLARERKAGVLAQWTAQALLDVSASTRSLEEKRRRIAWLLRDVKLDLALESDRSTVETLAQWLPDQDWAPLIKAAANDEDLVRAAVKAADTYQRPKLACRWLRAHGDECPAQE